MDLNPIPIQPDIEALDRFLSSDRALDAMMLSELDGFLTGVAIGPELIMPSEWMPHVWGGGEPEFDSPEEMQSVLGTIMGRYNEILRHLDEDPEAFAPIYWEDEDGEVIAEEWAAGFLEAVHLRPKAWDRLLRSRDRPLIVPILLLATDPGEWPAELSIDPASQPEFLSGAVENLPICVIGIHDFWKRHTREPRQPKGPKVGRNAPCPCGSNRKFKQCCGAS